MKIQQVPALPEGRPETGPMQFGDDWPGVFIRGDNAGWYAMLLSDLLENKSSPTSQACLKGLVRILQGCIISPTEIY